MCSTILEMGDTYLTVLSTLRGLWGRWRPWQAVEWDITAYFGTSPWVLPNEYTMWEWYHKWINGFQNKWRSHEFWNSFYTSDIITIWFTSLRLTKRSLGNYQTEIYKINFRISYSKVFPSLTFVSCCCLLIINCQLRLDRVKSISTPLPRLFDHRL